MRQTWEILLVVDRECSQNAVSTVATYIPIWMIASPGNLTLANDLRAASNSLETGIRTFKPFDQKAPFHPATLIDVLELYHPYLTRLNIFGIESSTGLEESLFTFNFVPTLASWDNTIAFKRPLNPEITIPHFELDASNWRNEDDVYDSLFAALGAPEWHGRNFNALHDSIITGAINAIEVPFKLFISGFDNAQPPAREFTHRLITLFDEYRAVGCPISIEIANHA